MNRIYNNIKRIEFVITNACTGKCKHCSAAVSEAVIESVNADTAVKIINQLASRYKVESIMTFGGEPLLYADTVCKIHSAARDCGIAIRQIITNGFFSNDVQKIHNVAAAICASGANNIMLSVDVFHQEYIPIEPVILFAESLLKSGVPELRVHPAWLVNEQHQNPYNNETKRLLKIFNDKAIKSSNGNNIFLAGNASKYLSEYFLKPETVDLSVPCGEMPYTSRLDEINGVSISPNGDLVLCSFAIGNIYKDDILTIIDSYDPYANPVTRALIKGGADELLTYAKGLGISVDINDCYSACGVCRKTMAALKERRLT